MLNEYQFPRQAPNGGNLFLKFLAVIAGVVVLDYIFRDEDDTVNYTLKNRGRKVYHGITYEDRLDARLMEHQSNGKRFDECIYDQAKPRLIALQKERQRIKRDKTKYNIHHKF